MKTNLDQIKAGADIHAGDGGYRTSTHEAQAKFAQARNQSLARSRFLDLAIQADIWCDQNWHDESTYNLAWEDKFAELIARECVSICEEHPAWTGRMISEQIKQHFGVEE
jgi:hypothetical protein